jgi:hypothetical protein
LVDNVFYHDRCDFPCGGRGGPTEVAVLTVSSSTGGSNMLQKRLLRCIASVALFIGLCSAAIPSGAVCTEGCRYNVMMWNWFLGRYEHTPGQQNYRYRPYFAQFSSSGTWQLNSVEVTVKVYEDGTFFCGSGTDYSDAAALSSWTHDYTDFQDACVH